MKKAILILAMALTSVMGFSQVATKAAQDTANARLSLIKTAVYSNSVTSSNNSATLTLIKKANDTITQNLRTIINAVDSNSIYLARFTNTREYRKKIANTITTNAVAYSSGDNIGGINTITNALRTNGGSARLTDIEIWSKESQTFNATIDIWSASPGGTYTNNSAQVVAGDEAVWLGSITVLTTDFVTTGAISRANIKNLNISLANAAAKNIFFTIVTTSTPTWAVGTTGVIVTTGIVQD